MTYSRVESHHLTSLHPPHERIVSSTRRLYAQAERNLKDEEGERSLAWVGMLICLAGGALEVGFLRWIFY